LQPVLQKTPCKVLPICYLGL